MSKVRSDNYVDRAGTGAPTFPNGVSISGVLTATTIGGTTDTILIPGNLTVQGTETIINTEKLDVADKTVGVASTSTASNTTAADAGLVVYGGDDGNKTLLYDNTKKGFDFNIPLATDETRVFTVSEKSTLFAGNTATLTYAGNSSNIAICTSSTGPITLSVTGIPTTSDFDNSTLTFCAIINGNAGLAHTVTAVNLNGVSKTIQWAGGSITAAVNGLTTSHGYYIQSFTGINTVGSASTCDNYTLLGVVSGAYH